MNRFVFLVALTILMRPWMHAGLVLATTRLLACQDSAGSSDSVPTLPTGGSGAVGAGGTASTPALRAASAPGLRRLTRVEYANTVKSLVGATVPREAQPKETLVDGHSEIAAAQKTGYDDTDRFYDLAESTASLAAADVLKGSGCTDLPCLKAWTPAFLRQAFRGAATNETIADYQTLLNAADAGDTLVAKTQTLITAALASPYFLYRAELGGGRASPNLAAHELASRLSYLVWQTMPDQALLDLAEGGGLASPDQRAAALRSMLADTRSQGGLLGFTQDWFGVFDDVLANKDAKLLATAPEGLPALARQSFELSLQSTLAAPGSKFTDLLRLESFYVNGDLASLLGVTASGDSFELVAVPASERRGLLTHPLLIGAHSKESGASPFSIGKFVYENVLCRKIPPPQAGIPKVDETTTEQTLRQKLEGLTAGQPCATCHEQIGPPGFAFLPFDPIGRYSAKDGAGRPYDTAGLLRLPSFEEPVPFADVTELTEILASQPDVTRCVARRLYRFAYGRFEVDADAPSLTEIDTVATNSNAEVAALLESVVKQEQFIKAEVAR